MKQYRRASNYTHRCQLQNLPLLQLKRPLPVIARSLLLIERGYTLTDHIARLKAQADEQEQTGPTDLEQAIMNKLLGYGLFLAKRCTCGSRLKRPMAGGMSTVCARCEPGGLWSYQAIEMLN